ncbi:hypothetical protein EZS27_009166, partial [termite gut metagenome]
WAQFSEVFGMPIREYVYETDDDQARQKAIEDAENTGSLAVLIHSKESTLNLLESGNKTGSAELYERLCERCNSEISKLMLGNTLTTEASDKGTQALGTVHKKVEDETAQADRRYVLDVLNYDMTDIFLALGVNTTGGEFCFPEPDSMSLTEKAAILSDLHTTFKLPVSDDYLYETFGVEKPKNYKELKELPHQQQEPPQPPPPGVKEDEEPEPTQKEKKSFLNRLRSFFVRAPRNGAALNW